MPHTSDTFKGQHTKSSATDPCAPSTVFRSGPYLEKLFDRMAELDRAAICARISQAREEAGLTQPELGDSLSPPVHWRTVQTWESVKKPRVPWDRLDDIARVTGTSKEWLLHGDLPTAPEGIEGKLAELVDEVRRLAGLLDEWSERQEPQSRRRKPA
jgi:DNA-binding transcriptional regulator YiaG